MPRSPTASVATSTSTSRCNEQPFYVGMGEGERRCRISAKEGRVAQGREDRGVAGGGKGAADRHPRASSAIGVAASPRVYPRVPVRGHPRIKEEFENGRDYYALHGSRIRLPEDIAHRPAVESLIWQNEERFLG